MSSRHIRGPLVFNTIKNLTAAGNYTVVSESAILVNKSSGEITTITIPAPVSSGGRRAILVVDAKGDAATYNITIATVSGNINGSSTYIIRENYGAALLIDDGAEWIVTAVSRSHDKIKLPDSGTLTFGSDGDLVVQFNSTDNIVTAGPSSGLWANAPSLLDPDPGKFTFLFDDFLCPVSATVSDYMAWTAINDGGTGTPAFQDAAGGIFNVVTAAADNDYAAYSSVAENWLFAAGKKLWFEARFKLTEANTNESAWWFGLTDTLTTGGFQANAAGPLASYDGALIWKDEGDLLIDFETSNAGTQATVANIATFISNTWFRAGFYFDGTATTSTITPWIHNGTAWASGTAQNITLSGLEEMHLVYGVKAGPMGGAETLMIDYIKCLQLR